MICSQCHASAALQPSLIGLPLADALSMEVVKLGSVQRFCHAISDHLIHWTIFDVNVTFGLLVGNVEVSDVQVTRALANTLVSVVLEEHGTFVVLIEDILLDGISLCLEE